MKIEIRSKDGMIGIPHYAYQKFELVVLIEGQSFWRHLSFHRCKKEAIRDKEMLEGLKEKELTI